MLSLGLAACGGEAKEKASGDNQQEENMQTQEKYNQPRKDLGRPKSVLILSSSPRRGGNSEELCIQFKKGAEEAGHSVEMININDLDIRYFNQREYDPEVSGGRAGAGLPLRGLPWLETAVDESALAESGLEVRFGHGSDDYREAGAQERVELTAVGLQ